MPQTREHINVCALLGIRTGIVVVTHGDKVEDPEIAMEFIREELQGTFLAEAPHCLVCPPKKQGVAQLVGLMEELASALQVPPRPKSPPRCPWTVRSPKKATAPSLPVLCWRGRWRSKKRSSSSPQGKGRASVRFSSKGPQRKRFRPRREPQLTVQTLSVDGVQTGSLITKRSELHNSKIFDAKIHWLPHNAKRLSRRRGLSLYIHAAQAIAHVQAFRAGGTRQSGHGPHPARPRHPHHSQRALSPPPATRQWGGIVGGGIVVDAKPRRAAVARFVNALPHRKTRWPSS